MLDMKKLVLKIIADGMINSGNDGWLGYDIKTENTVDMKEAGIIDPTKVVRLALENAASVAGTVLLTECTVVSEPEKENNSQPQNGSINDGDDVKNISYIIV